MRVALPCLLEPADALRGLEPIQEWHPETTLAQRLLITVIYSLNIHENRIKFEIGLQHVDAFLAVSGVDHVVTIEG